MPDTQDWKEKYRESVLELETEERRWRQAEKVLRRLVNRLCAAAMGTDDRLDDELAAIAAANRRNAAVTELERMASSLTSVVTAVDLEATSIQAQLAAFAAAPQKPSRWDATCAAVRAVLEQLAAAATAPDEAIAGLLATLENAAADAEVAAVLKRAAEIIRERAAPLAREREQVALLLGEVSRRLEELVEFFTVASESNRIALEDTAALDSHVMREVDALTKDSQSATDLRSLQSLVNRRLEAVGQSVHDYRTRTEARVQEQTLQSEQMITRVFVLERETRELQDALNAERMLARVDALTNIPNRRAFDERLAQEIARRALTQGAVTLMLWDLDNFKTINDSYGHRIGDRVLKHVAGCLAKGVRQTDFVARIGGEEFGIVLIGQALESAQRHANDLRAAVEGLRFHFRGEPVRITVSCGITELTEGDNAQSAFDRADAALYRAKSSGKNICVPA
jgi:diguanylate cyclase